VIICGSSNKIILGQVLPNACKHCGTSNLRVYASKKLFDFFRILYIPYKTTYGIKCTQCGTLYDLDKLSIDPKGIKIKRTYTYMATLLLFPALAGCVYGYFFIEEIREAHYKSWKIRGYLNDLHVGDNLIVKREEDGATPYTMYKITHLDGEKITYAWSQFSFSNLDGLKDQLLNPQTDQGRGEFQTTRDKLKEDIQIVDIYGPARYISKR
jgi:hypothetical protein